jgi:nucleoside-diphosphate-sugar epimerase
VTSTSTSTSNSEQTRLLVTGDNGFIGRHVLASCPDAVGLSSLGEDLDIRDEAGLRNCLGNYCLDTVLHFKGCDYE